MTHLNYFVFHLFFPWWIAHCLCWFQHRPGQSYAKKYGKKCILPEHFIECKPLSISEEYRVKIWKERGCLNTKLSHASTLQALLHQQSNWQIDYISLSSEMTFAFSKTFKILSEQLPVKAGESVQKLSLKLYIQEVCGAYTKPGRQHCA